MTTKTTTTYECDGCGKEFAAKQLRRFELAEKTMDRKIVAEARFDLCLECHAKLLGKLADLMPHSQYERINEVER